MKTNIFCEIFYNSKNVYCMELKLYIQHYVQNSYQLSSLILNYLFHKPNYPIFSYYNIYYTI